MILEKWKGEVTEVFENSFSVFLEDKEGRNVIAEIDKDNAKNGNTVYVGARVKIILTPTEMDIRVEKPRIWKEEYNKKVDELVKKFFPEI